MTGLYSKNKLLETVEHMEPKERPVVVIYWDVNQLKYVTIRLVICTETS